MIFERHKPRHDKDIGRRPWICHTNRGTNNPREYMNVLERPSQNMYVRATVSTASLRRPGMKFPSS